MVDEEMLHRDYKMSDADLSMMVSNLVNDMSRDVVQFTSYGITQILIDALETLGNEFEELPTDPELEADVMESTEIKKAKLEEVKETIRNMATRVEFKWGTKTSKYKRLMIAGMNNITDNDLIVVARRVHRVMVEYLSDLSSEGLTAQMLSDMDDLNQEFEDAKNLQHDKVFARGEASKERLLKGNAIYDLVSRYCDIGKRIWINVDPIKYDNYVIYGSGTGGHPGVIPPGVPELGMTSTGFFFGEVLTATSYQLVYKLATDLEFQELYLGPHISEIIPFPPGMGSFVAKIRARNSAGYGEYSEELSFNVGLLPTTIYAFSYNNLTHEIVCSWSSSAGADFYDVYRSRVTLGDPPAAFVLFQSVYDLSLVYETTEFNVTDHLYCVVRQGTQSSTLSNTVPVNIPNPV